MHEAAPEAGLRPFETSLRMKECGSVYRPSTRSGPDAPHSRCPEALRCADAHRKGFPVVLQLAVMPARHLRSVASRHGVEHGSEVEAASEAGFVVSQGVSMQPGCNHAEGGGLMLSAPGLMKPIERVLKSSAADHNDDLDYPSRREAARAAMREFYA